MQRLSGKFSPPGGVPSHVAPETAGSIHDGGDDGYSLSRAFGAAFDNPCFRLHLNRYKIAHPAVFTRVSEDLTRPIGTNGPGRLAGRGASW